MSGDSTRLSQVVANLLNNASQHSPERARIEIVIDGSGSEALVEVRDPGAGIDAQLLPHLFELFLQGDRTLDRSQGGLGVGLTIVKLVVEMHGGRVEAHSEGLGKGSEFTVRLPLKEASRRQPAAPTDVASSRFGGLKRRILVADDNPDVVGAAA